MVGCGDCLLCRYDAAEERYSVGIGDRRDEKKKKRKEARGEQYEEIGYVRSGR